MKAMKRFTQIVVLACFFLFVTKYGSANQTIIPPIITEPNVTIGNLDAYEATFPPTGSYIVPVQVSEIGRLSIYIGNTQLADTARFSFFSDAECKMPIAGANFTLQPNVIDVVGAVDFKQAGVYYIEFRYSNNADSTQQPGSIQFVPFMLSRAERTLEQNVWSTGIPPSDNSTDVFCQIKVPSNGYIGIEVDSNSPNPISISLCKNKTSTIVTSGFTKGTTQYYPMTAGTYYLKTRGAAQHMTQIRYTTTTGMSLKENKAFTYTQMGVATFDFKIKAEKTGTLTLANGTGTRLDAELLNSKKKAIASKSPNLSTYTVAVKKGVTYYLRVSKAAGMEALAYKINKASEGKNTSQKKATTLKKNKKSTCLFIADGKKKTYWYRISFKKSTRLNINIPSAGNKGIVRYTLTGRGIQPGDCTVANGKIRSYRKLPRGTYYLKVTTDSAKTSGRVDIKLK
jgi:hypothetical protein